jgi:hypothetical protein
MKTDLAVLLISTAFRLGALVAGVSLCSMGYRLFQAGADLDLGNRPAWFRAFRYAAKNAVPALLFAAAGLAVLALALLPSLAHPLESVLTTGLTNGKAP